VNLVDIVARFDPRIVRMADARERPEADGSQYAGKR
jgi:hypothetical protein